MVIAERTEVREAVDIVKRNRNIAEYQRWLGNCCRDARIKLGLSDADISYAFTETAEGLITAPHADTCYTIDEKKAEFRGWLGQCYKDASEGLGLSDRDIYQSLTKMAERAILGWKDPELICLDCQNLNPGNGPCGSFRDGAVQAFDVGELWRQKAASCENYI